MIKSENGSFTIEASLTFPLVFLCTLAVIFACLFFYQRVVIHYTAAITAERAAFAWDNSAKDQVTGSFDILRHDGLYWRIFQDHTFDIFHFFTGKRETGLPLPSTRSTENLQGVDKKLQRAANMLSPSVKGELKYTNYLLLRKIETDLEQPAKTPLYVFQWLKRNEVKSTAASYIVEPVEFIRTVDLIRTFVQEIKGRIKPDEAVQMFQEPAFSQREDVQISNHNQAAEYLRRLVNGVEKNMVVSVNPKRTRLVDALDVNGVAHQAFYTFSEFQLKTEQLPKDVELLKQSGQVKGVVWHFFKQSKKDKVELSASFREEVGRIGIVVVIHE